MLQAVLLKASIGAFHHLLEYVFLNNDLANDSRDVVFAGCQKGQFGITTRSTPQSLDVIIQNAGLNVQEGSGHFLSSDKFGSNRIGATPWELPDNCLLTLYPAQRTKELDDDRALWESRISIRIGDRSDEDTRVL